jgi:AcrR family transcriptional regulator
MARPDTNREERKAQIARVATHVFARYGYEGTTNKLLAQEIQEREGSSFSPALIYHYFESKEELFKTVAKQFPPPQKIGAILRANMEQPPEIFFRLLAQNYLELLEDTQIAQLVRMIFTESSRHPELTRIMAEEIIPQVILPTSQYLMRQIVEGRIKPAQPASLLLQVFGPLLMRVFIQAMGIPAQLPFPFPDRQQFVDEWINGLLNGLLKE